MSSRYNVKNLQTNYFVISDGTEKKGHKVHGLPSGEIEADNTVRAFCHDRLLTTTNIFCAAAGCRHISSSQQDRLSHH